MFLTSDNGLISAIFLRNLCVQKPKPVRSLRNLCVTIDQCDIVNFVFMLFLLMAPDLYATIWTLYGH